MAGGRGTRFWPKSRNDIPKQLLPIVGETSMLEQTLDRLDGLVDRERIFISTRQDLVASIRTIIPSFPAENYIIEPMGRDTAAAVGLAAIMVKQRYPDTVMVLLAADHVITPKNVFQDDLKKAAAIAKKSGSLITFGIQPKRTETGYGYIETGALYDNDESEVYIVNRFTEKPDKKTAETFIKKGNYLWNSGMFVWTVAAIIEAFQKYMPELFEGLCRIEEAAATKDNMNVITSVFTDLKKVSIDYGVMEKADNTLCIKGQFQWDDVGSWSALRRVVGQDEDGNITQGQVEILDSTNCICSSGNGLITVIGAKNLIIVQTSDAVLVADINEEQRVKEIVEIIGNREKYKHLL